MRGEERCVACEDRRPATPPARRRAAEIEQRLERARGDSERSRVRESSKGLWIGCGESREDSSRQCT